MNKDVTLIDKIIKRNQSDNKIKKIKSFYTNIPDYLLKLNLKDLNSNLITSIKSIKSTHSNNNINIYNNINEASPFKHNYIPKDFLTNLILTNNKNFYSAKVNKIIIRYRQKKVQTYKI